MSVKITTKENQAKGVFAGGAILENKPIGFPQDGGQQKPYSNLFYWANATTDVGGLIGEHPHKMFEIMSFVLEGEIEHYDSKLKGWKSLKAGDVQIIRSRGGISHAERLLENSRIFQIWFDPNIMLTQNKEASYSDYNANQFKVLEKGGVEFDRPGIKVDDSLRSVSNKKVYAAGDVAGGLQFTHVAGYHAGVLIRSLLFGLPSRQKTAHIPWATYTDPELAQVGLTEAQARAKYGGALEVVRFDFHHNDRLIAERKNKGLIKVMVVKGRPVGASIAGPTAGELIGMWAMAIANNMKMSAIANTVLPYPTISEVNKRAAGAYFSPRLFESDRVKSVVRFVQRWLP